MLAWLIEDVASPYGGVATLHWAVPDDADDHAMDKFNTTELQVRLESAEDQLGAVLWNSNPAALAYLHTHVFKLPSVSSEPATSSSTPSPPLAGKVVVELGAGVGCLGIALAMGGARVAVTDLKELLPLMAHNVKLNSKRIQSRSQGEGHCAAMQWKWGPTATTSVHKQLQRAFAKTGKTAPAVTGNGALRAAVSSVMASMAEELAKPSASLVECSTALRAAAPWPAGKAVTPAAAVPCHYVILCDALYGNPRDWPSLLYTLTELLATNPDECEIVNFCEQRVDDVEGAFLRLLDEENSRVYVPAAQREADGRGDPLWSAVVESAARCCPAASSSSSLRSADGETKIVVSSGATSSSAAAVGQHQAREAAAAALLNYVLVQRRGLYRWSYTTEVVAEAQSELDMTIRATRIRWTKVDTDTAAPSRRRPREAEESAEAQSRNFDTSAASDVRKKQKR